RDFHVTGVQTCALPISLPTSPATLQRDFMLAQRYQIISLIGQGGFAQVYKARDTSQGNQLVAIKQISLRGLSAQEMIDATATYRSEERRVGKESKTQSL